MLLAVAACDGRDVSAVRTADAAVTEPSVAPRQAAVVDSSLPLDEALRRFQVGLPPVTKLSGGAQTREALIRRFVRAVEQRDTTAVREMVLSRAEFAYLYYPHSPFTREPHRQMAGLVWFLTRANSSKGITRVFDRLGGRPLAYRGHRCSPEPRRQGPNVLWESCVLRLGETGEQNEMRLFGSVIERSGELKFVSFANDF